MNRRTFGKSLMMAAALGMVSQAPAHASTGAIIKAFDTRYPASAQWYKDAYAEDFRLMVLSTNVWGKNQPWPQAPSQLKLALDAGLKIAAYTRDPRWWKVGIQACGPYVDQLQFFALDIEDDPGIPVTSEMVKGVESMGVRPIIYSGANMWRQVMNNDTSFAWLPLWDANHNASKPVPYGDWNTPVNRRVGVQTVEEARLKGININVSKFSAAFMIG